MMVDASDMHLLCEADELLAKRRVLTGGDDNTVVVGGEPILWPDQQKFNGQSLSQNPEPYPVKNCVFSFGLRSAHQRATRKSYKTH